MNNDQEQDPNKCEAIAVCVSAACGTKKKSKLKYCELMFEVVRGRREGRRYSWKGYFNSQANISRLLANLRTSGWKGTAFARKLDMRGAPMVRITIHNELEQERRDGKPAQRFPKVAFINPVREIKLEEEITANEFEDLNRDFADMLSGPTPSGIATPTEPPGEEEHDDDDAEDWREETSGAQEAAAAP